MKKIIYSFLSLAVLFLSACSDDKVADVTPADRGTVTDDKGNEYQWVRIGDLQWTTTNAKNGPNASELKYFNSIRNVAAFNAAEKVVFLEEVYPVYGNYLTYDEALKSVPEGWRLPSDEDWQKLESILGMKDTDTEGYRGGNIGFIMQQSGIGCELGLINGGGFIWDATASLKTLLLGEVGEVGYYWTSTTTDPIDGSEQAYYRKICAANGNVGRNHTGVDRLFSVRWVRDAK